MSDEGDWEKREVWVPKGSKRSKSRDDDGLERELYFDEDGELLGPSKSRAIPDDGDDGDGESPFSDAIAEVVIGAAIAIGAVVVTKAGERYLPVVRAKLVTAGGRIRAKWRSWRGTTPTPQAALELPETVVVVMPPIEMPELPEHAPGDRVTMSRAEFRNTVKAVIATQEIADRLRQKLEGVVVDDDPEAIERGVRELQKQITSMDDQRFAEFLASLGWQSDPEGAYVLRPL